MNCQCNYYFNLLFAIQNRIAYYNCILNSSCSSECSKTCAKVYLETLNKQLEIVNNILSQLKCPGF